MSFADPRTLLGNAPLSSPLREYLAHVTSFTQCTEVPSPEIKAYKDAIYMNYYRLGLSLMFVGRKDSGAISQNDIDGDNLELDSIDIYNVSPKSDGQEARSDSSTKVYSSHPAPSLVLSLLPSEKSGVSRAQEIKMTPASTGKDIVSALGEPARKGGGVGPANGSIGIWCDWTKDGIMIEFDASGPQAWEHGKDTKWKVLTLYRPERA